MSFTKLIEADLSKAELARANLIGANLNGINLCGANLTGANLARANLHYADLRDSELRGAKLIGANLFGADLTRAQALMTNFSDSVLTKACLQDWNINDLTAFDNVSCQYFYSEIVQQGRRPREGTFKSGEFTALFQQVVDTVDLIFIDGLDWQSFFASFQELRQQYDDAEINIQAIEKKSRGAFVVRLEVSEPLDKAILQQSWNDIYEKNQQLQAQLLKTEGKLEGYKEQLDDFQQKVLKGMNAPKYELSHAQFAVGFAETLQRDQIGGTINNYGTSLDDITHLITTLREHAQAFPAENKDKALDVLKDLERDIQDPEPDPNRIGRRLKRLVAIATMVGALTGGVRPFPVTSTPSQAMCLS